jgi:TolB-like protein
MKNLKLTAVIIAAFVVVTGCTSTKPVPASSGVNTGGSLRTAKGAGTDELDHALREISDYLNKRIPADSKAVFLNVKSDWPDLSRYILDGLIENAVNDGVFSVVDRQQLDVIRSELNFQWSGEVSDASAQEIGQMLGAQTIVSGAVTTIGSIYHIQARAIAVQTAAIQGQFSQKVDGKGATVAALTKRVVPASSSASTVTAGSQTSAGTQTAVPSASVTAATSTQTAGNQTHLNTLPSQQGISDDRAGLYVNGVYQGQMDLLDSIDWIKLNAKNSGNYVIVLGKDEAVPYILLNFNNLQLSITLKASGTERRVRYDNNSPSYSLFVVGAGVTFILEDGITMAGLQNNSKSLVRVEGGNFIMNGGSIKDNKHSNDGGGVYIDSGTFTMNNGTISVNSIGGRGGGVCMYGGTFIMNNGTISGNSAGTFAGGVFVSSGNFSMLGGTISGNSTGGYGGGVYCSSKGNFTKSGSDGIIYGSNATVDQANKASGNSTGHAVYTDNGKRNSTARISQVLDSRQKGAAGGWE